MSSWNRFSTSQMCVFTALTSKSPASPATNGQPRVLLYSKPLNSFNRTTNHPESVVSQVMAKRSNSNQSSSNQRSTLGSQGMNGAVNYKTAAIKFDSSSCNTLGDREYPACSPSHSSQRHPLTRFSLGASWPRSFLFSQQRASGGPDVLQVQNASGKTEGARVQVTGKLSLPSDGNRRRAS